MMFVLWFLLAGIYGVTFAQLLAQRDTGALIVGMIAAAFVYLGMRNLRKWKRRHNMEETQ